MPGCTAKTEDDGRVDVQKALRECPRWKTYENEVRNLWLMMSCLQAAERKFSQDEP